MIESIKTQGTASPTISDVRRFCDLSAKAVFEEIFTLLTDKPVRQTDLATAEFLTGDIPARSGNKHDLPVETSEYLRELWWIASGQLEAVIQEGVADRRSLAKMMSNPEMLKVARNAYLQGIPYCNEDLSDLLKVNQLKAWNWLRDQVCEDLLQTFASGKSVATWKSNLQASELVVADDEVAAREIAKTKWHLPGSMIAVTFVDPD